MVAIVEIAYLLETGGLQAIGLIDDHQLWRRSRLSCNGLRVAQIGHSRGQTHDRPPQAVQLALHRARRADDTRRVERGPPGSAVRPWHSAEAMWWRSEDAFELIPGGRIAAPTLTCRRLARRNTAQCSGPLGR